MSENLIILNLIKCAKMIAIFAKEIFESPLIYELLQSNYFYYFWQQFIWIIADYKFEWVNQVWIEAVMHSLLICLQYVL